MQLNENQTRTGDSKQSATIHGEQYAKITNKTFNQWARKVLSWFCVISKEIEKFRFVFGKQELGGY